MPEANQAWPEVGVAFSLTEDLAFPISEAPSHLWHLVAAVVIVQGHLSQCDQGFLPAADMGGRVLLARQGFGLET